MSKTLKGVFGFFLTMALDLELDLVKNYEDGFYLDPNLEDHLMRFAFGDSPTDTVHLIFLALEARGEILPYFLNPQKTREGCRHQYKIFGSLPKLFLIPETQVALEECIVWLRQNGRSQERAYQEYDALVRPYSYLKYVDLTAPPLLSPERRDRHVVEDLSIIMEEAAHRALPSHDAVALAIIYLTSKGYDFLHQDFSLPQDSFSRDPQYFFAALPGEAGRNKRASQQRYIGLGDALHERVSRALLDSGGYFEQRFEQLKEILPHVDVSA